MTDFTINLDVVCDTCGEELKIKQRSFKIYVTPCKCVSIKKPEMNTIYFCWNGSTKSANVLLWENDVLDNTLFKEGNVHLSKYLAEKFGQENPFYKIPDTLYI